MSVNPPDGAPSWIGWALFGLALVVLAIRELTHARSSAAERAKAKAETLKIQLDGVRESADGYGRQLTAVAEALSADREGRPSLAQIEAREASARRAGDQKDLGLVSHLKARELARKELPKLVQRLVAARDREAQLTRDLARGIEVHSEDVSELRTGLDAVVADLGGLVRDLAASPRVFIQLEEPGEGQDGDLWFPIPATGE